MDEEKKRDDKLIGVQERITELEEYTTLRPEHISDDDVKAGNTDHRFLKITVPSGLASGTSISANHQYGIVPEIVFFAMPEAGAAVGQITMDYDRDSSTDVQIVVTPVFSGAANGFTVWCLLI